MQGFEEKAYIHLNENRRVQFWMHDRHLAAGICYQNLLLRTAVAAKNIV